MKRIALIMLLASTPVAAQDPEEAPEGRGIEELLRDLFSEVEPALRQLRDAIGGLREYHAPEMLPNGDIIIRRKTPLDPEVPPGQAPADKGESEGIEL